MKFFKKKNFFPILAGIFLIYLLCNLTYNGGNQEGFIEGFSQTKNDSGFDALPVQLHYRNDDTPGIVGLKRVSKPGLRIHVGKGEIPRYYGGLGVSIISTSKGVMTGQQAKENGVGGELLCYVW